MTTPANRSLGRGLALLEAVGQGHRTLVSLAAATGLPSATVHRLVRTLETRGFLVRPERGIVVPGPTLTAIAASFGAHDRLAACARPIVRRLAQAARAPAQLAVFDGDMATYLVKEGADSAALFTREGEQLEAYCSALGKVLLAGLLPAERATYLADGPFVALTERTITDPARLDEELTRAAASGFATDDGEADANLFCLAVPVRGADGAVIAALSLSRRDESAPPRALPLALLSAAAARITAAMNWPNVDS